MKTSKNCVVVGAGLSGLALAWNLLAKGHAVTLMDSKGVGAGASGIASGLLHPYPGRHVRRSPNATEALEEAKTLLNVAEEALGEPVSDRRGIIRIPIDETQRQELEARTAQHGDIDLLENGHFLIRSGITVFPKRYLHGLWKACEKKGATLQIQKIKSTEELATYDAIYLATGAGVFDFSESASLPIKGTKGQILTCQMPIEKSFIHDKYFALSETPGICHIGATYEREYEDDRPDLEKAKKELKPTHPILDCLAGIRVMNKKGNHPIAEQIGEKTYVLTALGSRGLLYHAYIAKYLTER